jgi:putative DNA primase/helicase
VPNRRTCFEVIHAAGLEQQTRSGEILVKCPRHDDNRPSLRVHPEKDCWKCDPCGTSGNAWELMAYLAGSDPGDKKAVLAWRDAHGLGNGAGKSEPKIVIYGYQDENRNEISQTVRKEPKTFFQRRPDGRGGYIENLNGIRRVPFRLPELLESDPSEFVFIVEGEKDVLAIAERGGVATCNAMGAGKWQDGYSEFLRNRHCIVIPDNDEPGRQHANQVSTSLVAHGAASVRMLELPNLPAKGDTSDFFQAGGTFEQLRDLATKAPVFAPAVGRTQQISTEPEPVLVRLSNVKPQATEWVWRFYLPRGSIALVYGNPGEGKTTFTIDCASRISVGANWPDGTPSIKGSVVILSCEDRESDIRNKVDLHGGDPEKIHVLRAIRRGGMEQHFSLVDNLLQLEKALDLIGDVVLLVVDPLSAYLGSKDSYKDSEIRTVLGPLALLAERRNIGVIAVMHVTKNSQTQALYRAQGSIAFIAAARTAFTLGKHPDDDRRRVLACAKNNLAAFPPSLAFEFKDGLITWDTAPVNLSADALLATPQSEEDREERRSAEDLLREVLADGPVWSKDVFKAGQENGLSQSTLERAKSRLKIEAKHFGRPGERGAKWYWRLPDELKAATVELSPRSSNIEGTTEAERTPALTGLIDEAF